MSSSSSLLYDDLDEPSTEEDEHQVTRIDRIGTPRTLATVVGDLFSRLYRRNSMNLLTLRDTNVNIGVSVQHATAAAPPGDEDEAADAKVSTDFAATSTSIDPPQKVPHQLRRTSGSCVGLAWTTFAKSFTEKVGQKRTRSHVHLKRDPPIH
jgi:hypothetical protein